MGVYRAIIHPIMEAAILAVGTELLGVERLDTNSLVLARVLERYGVNLCFKAVLPDSVDAIEAEIVRQKSMGRVILVTGGLGPTADDVTREALAAAFDRKLILQPALLKEIEDRFLGGGTSMPRTNEKQAEVPAGARVIENPRGTAPGLILEDGGCTLFAFPGVPHELEGMIDSSLKPWLRSRGGGDGIERRVVKVACLSESLVEERVQPAYQEFGRENLTVLARPGEIHLWVAAQGSDEERDRQLSIMQARVSELIGDAVFATDPALDLEHVVVDLLRDRGESVATAESCTGGLVGSRITGVAGSSEVFPGGAVAYSNRLKQQLLEVPAAILETEGAVSAAVAAAMAAGAARILDATWGIGITGIAGPGGGSAEKPVGTVYLAVAHRSGEVRTLLRRFHGDRSLVRGRSAQWALEMLRRRLLALEDLV